MGEMIINEQPLTVDESGRLTELEQVIKENFLGFVAVGNALQEIRDRRLYRNGENRTFEGYCAELWEMSKQHAYRLIKSSKAIENVTNWRQNNGQVTEITLPQNEAQARELAKLNPEDQVVVWQRVVEKSRENGGRITARLIKGEAKKFIGGEFDKERAKSGTVLRKNAANKYSEAFAEAWDALWMQVQAERIANWRNTSKKVVLEKLTVMKDLLREDINREFEEPGCAMGLADREKLFKAGFSLFSLSKETLVIEKYIGNDRWVVASSHTSFKAMLDAYNELMNDAKNLRA